MRINSPVSSLVSRVSCALVTAWVGVIQAHAVADEWINFGDNTKHTFTREGTTWGLLIPNNGGPAQGAHVSASVAANTPNSWHFHNETAAKLVVLLNGTTINVPAGGAQLIVGTNFTFELDYGTGSPSPQEVLTVTSRDNDAGLDLNRYTYYFGGTPQSGGIPNVTVTLLATGSGVPVELTAGHVWPFSLSHLTGSIMAMGTTMMPAPVPTLSEWGLIIMAGALLVLGAVYARRFLPAQPTAA